jgi:glycosyltransferase involved in cell wall biosynthesis
MSTGQPDLNVAMVLQSYPPVIGGAQRQVKQLAPLLLERGIGVRVITRRVAGTPRRVTEHGAVIERLRVPRGKRAASAAYVAGATWRLLRSRPDLIHAFDLLSPSVAALAANAANHVPVVVKVLSTGPGGDVDRLTHKRLGGLRARLIAQRFTAFHAVSSDVEAELLECGVDPKRIVRVANGVDCGHHRPPSGAERMEARLRFGIGRDELLTLYCGRFAPVKRLDTLLEAFRAAPGHLLLVGDGEQEPHLRELARDPQLAGRVSFVGKLDDPSVAYRAADIYVSTSTTEGMSNAILEAMASGLAVVASRAGGMAEILGDGAGVILARDDAAALGAELARLGAGAELRARLGSAARARVERCHGLAAVADQLAILYRQLAATRRPRPIATSPWPRLAARPSDPSRP